MNDNIGAEAGARLRARRLERGVSQAALARSAGISASYLNLIEHGRRRVAGGMLAALASALGVDPGELTAARDARRIDGLARAAAALPPGPRDPAPEAGGAEALAARYPGWAALVLRQARRIAALERRLSDLGDRMAHDQVLAASVHDILSTATAIRSTAAILNEGDTLDPEWQTRFHRNLGEDSRRLADRAQDLAGYLTAGADAAPDATTPLEEVEAFYAAHGFHIAEIEDGGAPDALIAGLPAGPVRSLLHSHLRRYAADVVRLPMPDLRRAIDRHGPDPASLSAATGAPPALVMRRLAALPEAAGVPPMGLVVVDGAGGVMFRKPVPGFSLPRYGAACAIWPLVQSIGAPQRVFAADLVQGGQGARPVRAVAVTELAAPPDLGGAVIAEATMVMIPRDVGADAAQPVGVTCRLCARRGCSARREPSILPGAETDGPL